MTITRLRVEHQKDPIGIGRKEPVFSFEADGEGEFLVTVRAEGEITVARRTVRLPESGGFRFEKPFAPAVRYEWSVGCDGTLTTGTFETAPELPLSFLTPEDPSVTAPEFFSTFVPPEHLTRARLYVTGLGLYRVFLNGKRVGNDYLTPGCNDYDAYLRAGYYDVTDFLREGENEISVFLGDGWYRGRYGIDKPEDRGGRVWGSEYLLGGAFLFTDRDGRQIVREFDASWRVRPSGCIENSIYDGEAWDFTVPKPVSGARVVTDPRPVIPEESAPIRVREVRKAKWIRTPSGKNVLDFGQNFAGFVRFRADLPKGTKVTLRYGEIMQDGELFFGNLRTARAAFSVVSDGTERMYEPFFTYYGFRYVEVEGMDVTDPELFDGVVLSSDLPRVGACETGNEKINRLLSNTEWGMLSNFMDIPTDCPQRDERLGWTADAQVFAVTACGFADTYLFYRKYLRDLRVEQTRYYKGEIPMYAPSLRGEAGVSGAVWGDAATVLPWQIYQTYGDRTLLQRDYRLMRDFIETRIGKDVAEGDHGRITKEFTFGDWLALDGVEEGALKGGTDDRFLINAYYAHSLDLCAHAAAELGEASDAARYRERGERVREEFLKEYVTGSGRLAIDTQTAYAVCLAFDLYRDPKPLLNGFSERLKKDFYTLKCGFAGAPLALPVLFSCGMAEEAYRLLLREEYPSWLYEVNMGATTVWERWNSVLPDGHLSGTAMNSLNHYAYGSVCEAIFSGVAGLRRGSVGWHSAVIAPHPDRRIGKIDYRYRSPMGLYRSAWRVKEDGDVRLDVTVPAGCVAEILLPGADGSYTVGEGDHTVTFAPESDLLHPYSLRSLLFDLFNDPKTRELTRGMLPNAFARLTGENREFLLQSPEVLSDLPMFGTTREELEKFGTELRKI